MESDPALQPYYFKRGFTFCTDGQPGDFESLWAEMLANLKREPPHMWNELSTHDAVFAHLNGNDGHAPVPEPQLGRARKWVKGFTSKKCATVNAEAIVKIYYERCLSKPSIDFVLGTAVDRLLYSSSSPSTSSPEVLGVVLEDGRDLRAQTTILATGAWSGWLVNLDGVMEAQAVGIAYIQLTPDEYEQYKDIACHTNLVTGVNIFTPIGGLLKVLRRAGGVRNTVELPNPDPDSNGDRTAGEKRYRVSYPRTTMDEGGAMQRLAPEMEEGIRDELREIAPRFAERPFARTKYCWLEQTSDGEFLICPHPRYKGLQMATGGSLHGWKFLPLLGEFVVDSMTGRLDEDLVTKWSWESKIGAEMGKFGFMRKGQQRELRDVVPQNKDVRL